MDKRTILAIIISLGIWIGWQKIYLEPYQRQAVEQQKIAEQARLASLQKNEKTAATSSSLNSNSKIKAVNLNKPKMEKNSALSTNKVVLPGVVESVISNDPFIFQNGVLNRYKTEDGKAQIDLAHVTGFGRQLRLRLQDGADITEANWQWKNENTAAIDAGAIRAERNIRAAGEYYYDLNYDIEFRANPPKFLFIDLLGSPSRKNDKEGSILGQAPDKVHVTYRDSKERKMLVAAQMKEGEIHEAFTGIKWLGIDTKYFVFALVPNKELRQDSGIQVSRTFFAGESAAQASLVVPVNGRNKMSIPLRVYFGPKQLEYLEKADPILADTIDFGWTSVLAMPLLKGLKWLYTYFRNYGIAIILLTAIIKILLFPLTYKSMKAMAKMAKLQPQLNALREKYKDNKEKLNVEMMSFMKTHGYNPVGGCLPMLLQMPIFFALYRVFFNSMELYQAPFYFWIADLSAPDHFFVTPVLLCGLMFLQQKLSPSTAADPAQQKMLQIMPVLFGVFMLMLPAGLNIYMLVNSIISISQQWYLNRRFGVGAYAAKSS